MNFLLKPLFLILFLIAPVAHGQENLDFTHISFSSESEFLTSLEEVVSIQTEPPQGEAAIKVFSGDSAQISPSNLEQLISALPVPANNIVESVERLDILSNKIWTRKLQSAVLHTALTSIQSDKTSEVEVAFGEGLVLAAARVGLVAVAFLSGGPLEIKGTVLLAADSSSIAENSGGTITLTATLSKEATSPVTVSFSTSGAAAQASDYGAITSITIEAGNTTGTVSFTPTDDSI